MLLLGAHTINNGGIHMAVRRAGRSAMRTVQVFTAEPKYYNEKISVKPERAARFTAALAEAGIEARHVVTHAAYVLNLATADEEKYSRSRTAITKELERSSALGIGAVCFHSGSAGTLDPALSAQRIGEAMVHALTTVESSTRLLVENTAGGGRTMGRTADEVAAILSHVPPALRTRTGYGLDTCHLYASGHDLTVSADAVSAILDQFESATGEPPSFFHLNDSEGALGSNRDRHMLIGEGKIGLAPFRWLLADPRTRGVPLILETPQEHYDIDGEDDSPDPDDVKMMRLVEELAGSA